MIIISTHIVDDLAYIAAQIMVLSRGQLAFVGSSTHLAAQADGLTYSAEVPLDELAGVKHAHAVTAVKHGGQESTAQIHVLRQQDTLPSKAEPVRPTLEDGYLAVLGKEAVYAE